MFPPAGQGASQHPPSVGQHYFFQQKLPSSQNRQVKTHPYSAWGPFVLPGKASAFAALRFSSVGRIKGHHIQNLHLPPLTTSASLKKLVLLIKIPWSASVMFGKLWVAGQKYWRHHWQPNDKNKQEGPWSGATKLCLMSSRWTSSHQGRCQRQCTPSRPRGCQRHVRGLLGVGDPWAEALLAPALPPACT